MTGAQLAQCRTFGLTLDPFYEQFANHFDELGVCSDGRDTDEAEPSGCACILGFGVEVKHDLHVIGDKADRYNDHVGDPSGWQLLDTLTDIGLQPRLLRWAASTLVHQLPTFMANPQSH